MKERRKFPRQRTLKGGTISLPTGSVECTIRNFSAAGARLEVAAIAGIPESFTLIIKPELLKRSCRVSWRSGNKLGVNFV